MKANIKKKRETLTPPPPSLPPPHSRSVTGGARRLQPPQRDAGLLRGQRQDRLRVLAGGRGAARLRLRQAAVGHPAAQPGGQGGPGSRGGLGAISEHPPAAEDR